MKVFLFSLALILSATLNAQGEKGICGQVEYQYYIDSAIAEQRLRKMELESPQKYNQYGSMFRGINATMNRLVFTLSFDQQASLWSLDPNAIPENSDEKFHYETAATMVSEAWKYEYYNQQQNRRVTQSEYMGSVLNITHPNEPLEWSQTGKTKKIGNYVTYEATATYHPKNRLEKDAPQILFAWYAPELPYPYGPRGVDGLPGLILALEIQSKEGRDRGFRAVDLNLQSTAPEDCSVELPKAVGTMSKQDFLSKVTAEVKAIRGNK
ncbi:GLPGLI family protein [Lewinella sp. W8]|uniref:GLPGLI family protein n=1 Tax=Lewinella sp. W8 TaxID=2528208 RepID=UPI001068B0D8|nr:GLPGLI family protein [Lewinella sp. W8]MTB51491.1 GLPGLI family protein [Lewinella sp. W8]